MAAWGLTTFGRLWNNRTLEGQEWKALYRIVNKTPDFPAAIPTVKEAVASLAKLGGSLGREGDGNPGVKVIWKGLKELRTGMSYLLHN